MVTRPLKVERRTVSVRRPKTGVPPSVLRNQHSNVDVDLAMFDITDSDLLRTRSCGHPYELLNDNSSGRSAIYR